ncbi:MAG: alanine racemase, partial [Pseudomonadota bacterium]
MILPPPKSNYAQNTTGKLSVDLDALLRNYRLAQELLPGKTVACVVKANAYGLGMDRIAPFLHAHGCKDFFVATIHEAIALRSLLHDATIAVTHGFHTGFADAYQAHQLIPCLITLAQVHALIKVAPSLACYVFFDTALNRLGLDRSDFDDFLRLRDHLNIRCIMSHLACADNLKDSTNHQQLQDFQEICSHFPSVPSSLGASFALDLKPEFCSDMLRLGVGLYGARTNQISFENVVTLSLPVLQIRTIAKNAGVGYGLTFRASRTTRIATVAGGYGDGIHRLASNKLKGRLHGHIVQQVGTISMDSMGFDITDTPDAACGDEITVLGQGITLA